MIFDTHSHYDDRSFDEDRDSLLISMPDNNVGKIVSVCAEMSNIDNIISLTQKYDFIYGSVGVHPDTVSELTSADIEKIRQIALQDKIVAIGEIGLDYHGDTPKDLQDKWFRSQLDLATELNMPVILHSRDACEDTLNVLNDYPGLKAVMHCYSYTKETAEILLNRNYYFGIGGVVTFKNAKKLVEAVKYIPLENIIVETDCPYLAPDPYRGKRNDSTLIKYVIDKIAEIKDLDRDFVEETTWNNAHKFYEL